MKGVTVQLKTGGHCIKRAAEDEMRRISALILDFTGDNVSTELTDRFLLLDEFLKNTDFNKLRFSDERLAGIVPAACILGRDERGKPVVKVLE